MFVFQLTGNRTEGNRRGGFLETRDWSRMFLRISNNNLPALIGTNHTHTRRPSVAGMPILFAINDIFTFYVFSYLKVELD